MLVLVLMAQMVVVVGSGQRRGLMLIGKHEEWGLGLGGGLWRVVEVGRVWDPTASPSFCGFNCESNVERLWVSC